jgi:hypothetical protein
MAAVVTPEHYGCVGDGVTDDTTNFQACLTAGHRFVFAKNIYKITSTLSLADSQILCGPPQAPDQGTPGASTPRIIFQPSGADKVCIKNAVGATGCGVEDLRIVMNANTQTAIQFASSYGNVAKRIQFSGTMNIGLLSDDTYVCRYHDLSFQGTNLKTAAVFVDRTNATTIERVFTESPTINDTNVCLYGVVARTGNAITIRDCTLQGVTIGVATNSVTAEVSGLYTEETLCCARFGDIASSQGKIEMHGGQLSAASVAHAQYASRGPLVILACNTMTAVQPNFAIAADNTAGTGPWPFVLDSCVNFTLVNPYHYNGADTTYARDLIYRAAAGSNTGITIVGSNFSRASHQAQEIVLKASGTYGSSCFGIRVDNAGTISTTAYQPAVIFAAINALLTTNLPTGLSLVL